MKILLCLAMAFSLLAATFTASAASADAASQSGCLSVENAEYCIDPSILPVKGGSAEKASKCLGPYLASSVTLSCDAGAHVRADAHMISSEGLSPRNPKRPPRI